MELLTRLSAGPKAYILVGLITLLAALPGVVFMPALDRDESRFAQASKQMLETGDFIRIRYQEGLRNKKPAGIHWLQAGATQIVSSPSAAQIWSYRLPSLLGAIAATVLCLWCGSPLIGRPAAFLGAAFFGVGILLTSEAHIAKTDAVLAALSIWSMGALGRLYLGQGRNERLALTIWASLAFAFLIKGPVTLWVVLLTLAGLLLLDRRADWMRTLVSWRGAGLFALIVLPWFVWVQLATDGAFIEGAVGKDLKDKVAGASEGHGGPPLYHVAFLTTHFFPATFLLWPGLLLAWQQFRSRTLETMGNPHGSGMLFLIAWALPSWIFFELLPTKLSHYILPVYPALALLCGVAGVRLLSEKSMSRIQAISLVHFTLGGALLLALANPLAASSLAREASEAFQTATPDAVHAAWSANSYFPLWVWALGLLLTISAPLAALLRRPGLAVCLALSAGLAVGGHIRGVFLPSQIWAQATPTALRALREVAPPTTAPVNTVGYSEPSLVFSLGTRTRIPPNTVVGLEEGDVWLINLEHVSGPPALAQLEAEALEARRCLKASQPHYALNYSNGAPAHFIALHILGSPC